MESPPARDAVLTAYAQSLIRFKAKQLSRKVGFSRSDEEDLSQELTKHLLARAHRFDPKRASANTFAERVIRTAVAMLLRDRRRQKRAAGFIAQSIEGSSAPSDEGVASLRDTLTEADLGRRIGTSASDPERAELIAAVAQAFQSLPAEDREVCRRLMEGTEASVAREMAISRRQVRNAIERIRRRFQAAGLGDS